MLNWDIIYSLCSQQARTTSREHASANLSPGLYGDCSQGRAWERRGNEGQPTNPEAAGAVES